MNKNVLNFISLPNCPVHTCKFIIEQSLPNYVTTCLSFLKISKLIFSAKYFESYFNLKLGHFYWDTLSIFISISIYQLVTRSVLKNTEHSTDRTK